MVVVVTMVVVTVVVTMVIMGVAVMIRLTPSWYLPYSGHCLKYFNYINPFNAHTTPGQVLLSTPLYK